MKKRLCIYLFFFPMALLTHAQKGTTWNSKNCAVVLTYDDGLLVHLKNALPALDSLRLRATFYIADYSRSLDTNISKWRNAAITGHELGNHTLYHPCEGGRAGREFVTPMNDMNNYTVRRMTDEISTMNTLLKAIDGKAERTFAYPCGDMKIRDTFYLEPIKNTFVAARGVTSKLQQVQEVDLLNVGCYSVNGQSGEELIKVVKEAEAKGVLLVFLFHGVGGGHGLNVSLAAHSQLLHYLKQHEKDIWIAPMLEVAGFIRDRQPKK